MSSINEHAIFISGWHFKADIFQSFAKNYVSYDFLDYPFLNHLENMTFEKVIAYFKEKIEEIIKLNENKKITLIAWSLGGLFAIKLVNLKLKSSKLILIGVSPSFSQSNDWPGISKVQQEKFYYLFDHRPDDLFKRFINLIIYPFKDKKLFDQVKAHLARKNNQWRDYLKILFECDLKEEFKKIKCDTFFIYAENDAIIQIDENLIKKLNNKIRLINIVNSNHILFITNKEIILDVIK